MSNATYSVSVSVNESKKFFKTIDNLSLEDIAELATKINYSLATYRKQHRLLDNFISTQLIGLDIDDGCTLNEAIAKFKDFKHIILTSKSHQKEKHGIVSDRFRVILVLERPITEADEFYSTWHTLHDLHPYIDKACKDPSRFWYKSPSLVSLNTEGRTVSVTEKVYKPVNTSSKFTQVNTDRKGVLAQSTIEFITQGAPKGQWNHTLYKAAKDMQQQLYSKDEAITMLEMPTRLSGNSGHLDASDMQTIDSAYKSQAKYEPRYDDKNSTIEIIQQCNLIIDLADNQNTHLVNLETGERFLASRQSIKEVMGPKRFGNFLEEKAIYANFIYQPYKNHILFKQPNGFTGYNMYTPPSWFIKEFYSGETPEPCHEIPKVMNSFLDHLTDNDTESKEYLLDWLHVSLTSRNYTMLTAIGEQGIGKGILGEVMRKLMGDSNFVQTRDEIFKKSFNSQLQAKRLVYVDELALNRKEYHDRLKHMVNDTLEVEAKGKDSIYIQNYASFYLSSNHLDAIKLQPGDRRFSIIQLTDEKILTKFTRTDIEHGILNDKTIEKFGRFLLHRKVERDMRIPFHSERFNEVLDAGLANWQRYILEQLYPQTKGKSLELKELKTKLQLEFPTLTPPGRGKLMALCKSFPDKLEYRRTNTGELFLDFKK